MARLIAHKWRDEPRGDVVVCQLDRRVVADPAGAAVADARIGRLEDVLGCRLRPDESGVAPWIRSPAMIDRQVRLREGDRMRRWVRQRRAEVCRAERAGTFTPCDAALQDAHFVAGLYRDRIAAVVADLLPPVDELIRERFIPTPLREREMRAARPVDAYRMRDALRLIDAVGPLAGSVVDPVLAIEMRLAPAEAPTLPPIGGRRRKPRSNYAVSS